MINLAPIRYARVLSKHDGPIEKIEYFRTRLGDREGYQANAYLSGHLNLDRPPASVFSAADGTGTHSSAVLARYMAVSEALERWALYYLKQSGMEKPYGFDKDPTSSGMAAYPGLFARQARRRARLEAIERYCVTTWWRGGLKAESRETPDGDLRIVEIENPLSCHNVVLAWRREPGGFHVYGHAAGRTLEEGSERATIELERASAALAHFHRQNPGFMPDDLETIPNAGERRFVYFSLPGGFREFAKRLEQKDAPLSRKKVAPVVDVKVPGPWDRYATVWRCLYPVMEAGGSKAENDRFLC